MIEKYKKGKHVITQWGHGTKQVTVASKDKNAADAPSVTVEVPAALTGGMRVNQFLISHNAEEVVLDLCFLSPGQHTGRIVSRVIMSPGQAKRFVGILEKAVKGKK